MLINRLKSIATLRPKGFTLLPSYNIHRQSNEFDLGNVANALSTNTVP